MRRLLLVLAASLLVAGPAHAAQFPFTGTATLVIGTLTPLVVSGTATATINGTAGGGHINSLVLAASAFGPATIPVAITDPLAFPIAGLIASNVRNGAADFAGGTGTGLLGGVMPLLGLSKVCLFAPCASAAANLSVPLSVSGKGGITTVSTFVNITVIGAPWTQGTAAIGTITRMGFAHGPASGTSSTAEPGGVLRLVTPTFISTNLPASPVVTAFGFVDFAAAPEPAALVLGTAAIGALVVMGLRRRRA